MKIKANNIEIMEISEKDKVYLKTWLPGDDGIMAWIVGAIVGKINDRKTAFFKEWTDTLIKDSNVDSIPTNEDDFRNLVIARSDYKDRVTRDKEERIKMEEETAKRLAAKHEEP
ncbi:MAG: hypothetical protein KAV87_24780 [Desulfobacteraceae bacterium]|nr:hypothetical protein [Desulfobacteraceae bacterium]